MLVTPGIKRLLSIALLGVLPVVTLVAMLIVAHPWSIALDFRNELYPEAKEILAWRNPFPADGADLYRGQPCPQTGGQYVFNPANGYYRCGL